MSCICASRTMKATGAALMLLLGGCSSAAPGQPPLAVPSDTDFSSMDWLRFKALWKSLESGQGIPDYPMQTLAASFGRPASEFEQDLIWTEMAASGGPSHQKPLPPAVYALALLGSSTLDAIGYEPPSSVMVTRMIMIPPGTRETLRLQQSEQIVAVIRDLKNDLRKGTITPDIALSTLMGHRGGVYRMRALRMAVELHRACHPAPAPASGPESSGLNLFLTHPDRFKSGSGAWLKDYQKAVAELEKDLSAPDALKLRQDQKHLYEALARLDESRARLKPWIENLEAAHP